MDVISKVRGCLGSWSAGGEADCRQYLFTSHCSVLDPSAADVLTTAYHTIVCSALQTWHHPPVLSPSAVVDFIQASLNGLPSSSSSGPGASYVGSDFGEILVDVIWSVDSVLEEPIQEHKAASTAVGGASASSVTIELEQQRVAAEKDKVVLQQIIRRLLELRLVDPGLCRERLDTAILAGVGLIQDKLALDKKEIRSRTGLFYKQNKFNLLREQSEGYSKLIVELESNLGPPHSPSTGRPTESPIVIECRARPVWEKIISLVGYFDLDPNRALDLILDAFSIHLATHYTFFLTLLSFSPWAGAYVPQLEGTMNVDSPQGEFHGKTFDEVLAQANGDCSASSVSPSSTNSHVLAQVLGFKFSYYQNQETPESAPKNLFMAAAVLIREGFITLEDIYPHLYPQDEEMGKCYEEYQKEVENRRAGAKVSQLAMAAPLESGSSSSRSKTVSSTPAPETKKAPPLKDLNQKAGLLIALLSVGALEPAIVILTKFPWIVDVHPEVADLLIQILKYSTSHLYETLVMSKAKNEGFSQPRARFGMTGVVPPPTKKAALTLCSPSPPSTNSTDFVFFFPDWVKRVPVCSTLDDLEAVVEPLMRLIGVHLYRDPQLIIRLVRLGKHHVLSKLPEDLPNKHNELPNPEDPVVIFWLKMLRLYLIPTLSLVRGNAVCQVEIWFLLKNYDLSTRWQLYGEWRSATYKSHPELRIRQVQAERESKAILRRLSKKSVNALAGQAAKLAHSNPCIYFTVAVKQIMSYDNLGQVFILGLRHSTHMDLDVLLFVLLDALATPEKGRLKDDGVNTADWLQSLASFTGMFFKQFQTTLTPLLTYIVNQLYNGQTTELLVFQQLIRNMAGIEPLPTLSDDQINAMAGGPLLRVEALASRTRGSQADINDNSLMQATARLGRSLLESGLALPLLIQVAQLRQSCVYKAPETPLKSLGSLYDTTHGVLLQYLELLSSSAAISPEDYATKLLPPIGELGQVYGISAPICMQIIRPILHHDLLQLALKQEKEEKEASEEAEKRLKAALTAKREPATSRTASPALNTSATDVNPEAKQQAEDTNAVKDEVMGDSDRTATAAAAPAPESPWLPRLVSLFDDVKKIIPETTYNIIGPGFYTTFWQLSTYDLSPPAAKYEQHTQALKSLSKAADKDYIDAERSSDRTKRAGAQAHRTRREHYNRAFDHLRREFREQTCSRIFTIKRLTREKPHWFAHCPKPLTLVNAVIEHCLQPRCVLSPMDADFCAQFIKVLQTQGTPGFHTLMCYDRLLGDHVKVVLFSCSEYEAHNYGRFLLGVLQDLHKWHKDEALYLADNRSKVGGKPVYHPGMQRTWTSKPATLDSLLSWADFQKVLRKWHKKLSKCFTDCLQTGEYMRIYNTIVILKELLPVFPLASVAATGSEIDSAVKSLLQKETRGDLKTLARAYEAMLEQKSSDWVMAKAKSAAPTPPLASTRSTERNRPSGAPPTGPSAQSVSEGKRVNGAPSSAPSGPRAQLASSSSDRQPPNGPASTKMSMESIPRPEVIKRIRPDAKSSSPKPPGETSNLPTDESRPPIPQQVSELKREESLPSRQPSPAQGRSSPMPQIASSGSAKEGDHASTTQPSDSRTDASGNMPPPSVPSQTLSAQELRETAKLSISRNERTDSGRGGGGSGAPSPRIRSPSPPGSRPGTRNGSADSRHSGGRSRSDRDPERKEDRRGDRDSRPDLRDDGRNLSRRDSLPHNRDNHRRERTRDSDKKDRDRDRDRGRDRHGEKEREREVHSDRLRDRDRERERDDDRHRRGDEKERDRDSRKDRESAPADGLPPRPDNTNRHRTQSGDDHLGKRRREDEVDRSSKRGSRRDAHREDRGRRGGERGGEKDGHSVRESDRRRRDREEGDSENRPSHGSDKNDRRSTGDPTTPSSAKGPPPSAPRAMSSTEPPKVTKPEPSSGREPARDPARDRGNTNGGPPAASQADSGAQSLQSRITSARTPPSGPQHSHRDDDRDHRKRTVSDREQESLGPSAPGSGLPGGDLLSQPPKRPRINRDRYGKQPHGSSGLARRTLPLDEEKARSRRG